MMKFFFTTVKNWNELHYSRLLLQVKRYDLCLLLNADGESKVTGLEAMLGIIFHQTVLLCSVCETVSHHGWTERQSACWHWCLMQLMCFCKSPSLDTQAVKSQSGRQWAQSAGWWSTFFPQQNVMSHTNRRPRDSVTLLAKPCHLWLDALRHSAALNKWCNRENIEV